jgi:ABC-type lipoprotein release transport system permease subunit
MARRDAWPEVCSTTPDGERMNIWKMAWRNVLRNRRRTTVTVGAMAFALFCELLYAGLIPGYMEGMEEDIVDLEVGDIQLHSAAYLEKPSIYEKIEKPEVILEKLDAAGYPASARIAGGGLVAAGENSAGVAFRGVDVARDAKVTLIQEKVATGKWLDPKDPKGVVVGKQLARTLNVEPGDELVVLSQATDGSMANDLFKVRGVLISVAGGTDRTVVYTNASALRELLVFPDGAHQIIVRRPDEVKLPEAAAFVKGAIKDHPGDVTAKTWKELMPIIATMLDSTQGMISIIFFIFYIAVGILVLNAMLMAVFERIREFGVLKAIGTGPGKVFSLIMVESFLQATLAFIIGGVLAIPGMWYLANHGINMASLGGTDMMGIAMRAQWYGIYRADTVQQPIILLFVVVFLAVLYPALKAAFIQPIDAMQHQ